MINRTETFLIRRQLREASRRLTQQIVLGYGFGLILLLFGGFKYFLSLDSWDTFWGFCMYFGILLMLCTLIAPMAIAPLEKGLRFVGNSLGHLLMMMLLTAIYYLLITPVGIALKRIKREHNTIYVWKNQPPTMEGWQDKKLSQDILALLTPEGRENYKKTGFLSILLFFIRAGKFAFVPVLIIVISIGLLLFFLQTSVVAPFIYTLF